MSTLKSLGDRPAAPVASSPVGIEGQPVPTTAVIFVHGIGSQNPGDTLLQWAAPIIEVLTAWKRWAVPEAPTRDPIDVARIDFKGAEARIELDIPAVVVDQRSFDRHRWILTEAWWAAKVAPPSLSTMTSWLGPQGGASQIVDAILGNKSDGTRFLRFFQGFVTPFVTVLTGLILTLYALLRATSLLIPIDAVRNAAVLQTFDNALTGWFGDVRILMFDPSQSANIRGGLGDAIRRLRDVDKVDHVIVMAHSGGVMVSYLLLADPEYLDAKVDKLITFGEGFNLAITLTPGQRGMFDRLRTDITAAGRRPELLWRDFWGSHDPAPAGRVKFDELGPVDPATGRRVGAAQPDHIRSREVWNRRSLTDDHGSYFENDEEFTLAVMREIDRPNGWGDTPPLAPPVSRFYPTPPPNENAKDPPADPRERRHRQRVAILALMRQLSIATAIGTITAVLVSPTRLSELGTGLGEVIAKIPVIHDLGAVLVPFFESFDPRLTVANPPFGLRPFTIDPNLVLDTLGLATLQAIVLVSILQLIFAPVQAYAAWPSTTWRRGAFQVAEWAIVGGLLIAVGVLAVAPQHDSLLGAGVQWLPGVVLTIATLLVGFVGTQVAIVWPSITRLYTGGATAIFVLAMVSAVLVMFRRQGLEHGELGYVVIWLAFLVLYRIGLDRWSQWDRVERRAAYAQSPDETRSRKPVWVSILGFLAAGIAIVLWVLPGMTEGMILFGASAIGLIVASIVYGAKAWPDAANPITNLSPVEDARGKV